MSGKAWREEGLCKQKTSPYMATFHSQLKNKGGQMISKQLMVNGVKKSGRRQRQKWLNSLCIEENDDMWAAASFSYSPLK